MGSEEPCRARAPLQRPRLPADTEVMNLGGVSAATATHAASVAVLAKVQDAAKAEGRAAVQLIDSASRVPRPDGTGQRVDVVA